jgi:hypothetical protein
LSDEALRTALALDYQPEGPPPPTVSAELDIGRYDRMLGPVWIETNGISVAGSGERAVAKAKIGAMPLELSGNILTAEDKGIAVTFDLAAVRARIAQVQCCGHPLLFPAREGSDRATLLVTPLWRSEMEAWLLLGRR